MMSEKECKQLKNKVPTPLYVKKIYRDEFNEQHVLYCEEVRSNDARHERAKDFFHKVYYRRGRKLRWIFRIADLAVLAFAIWFGVWRLHSAQYHAGSYLKSIPEAAVLFYVLITYFVIRVTGNIILRKLGY